jgi:hypothetical protein
VEDQNPVVIAGIAIAVVVILAAMLWRRARRRAHQRGSQDPLPLIPVASGRGGPAAPTYRSTAPLGHAPGVEANGRPDAPERFAPPVESRHRSAVGMHAGLSSTEGAVDPYADLPPGALADTARPADHVVGSAIDGASVRYWRPADGTLQFLPGRLEVIAGRDAGQDIRFVRTPGPDGTQVTFGRAEGAPYRHIQLREPTVSRAHARMTLQSGSAFSPDGRGSGVAQWCLENLSATNPVVVNGRALAADGGDGSGVELHDGDRIEMGEVVFRFHAK